MLDALAAVGIEKPAEDTRRLIWNKVKPGDPGVPPRAHLLMRAIAERTRWKAEYDRAMLAAECAPAGSDTSAIQQAAVRRGRHGHVSDCGGGGRYLNTSVRFVRRLIAERRIAFHKVGAHVRLALPIWTHSSRLGESNREGRPDMANKKGHRRFGWVRKLPSGRHQASYLGPDGLRRYARETFATKTDATTWLSGVETDMARGDWTDPLLAKITLAEYGARWIKERKLSVRTREEHERTFRLHISPFLGATSLGEIGTDTVRTWRTTLLDEGRTEIRVAKAYKLLRAIMFTAVDDGRIKRNPCRIKA